MKSLGTVVVALAMAGAAWADDELPRALNDGEREARLLELEARVRFLEGQQSDEEALRKLREAASKEKQEEMHGLPERVAKIEKGMQAAGQTWDPSKMLSFSTPDGNFTAKIGGRIYFVYRHIMDRDDSSGGAANSFIVDTARFTLDGTFYKDFMYKLEGEAAKGGGGNDFHIKEALVGWQGLKDFFTVRAGITKVPWSQEETTSSRFIDFAERSILNRLAPSFDTGIWVNGAFADKVVEWVLTVYNGSGPAANDANDEKEFAARVFISPLRNSGGIFKSLRLGVDVTLSSLDDATQGGLTNGDLGGVTINPLGIAVDGSRQRLLLNFSWLYGPFGLRAEYAQVNQELPDGAAASDFDITAYYVQATYLLTGEDKPLENRVKPKANFNPLNGTWGAWELAVRIAMLDSSDAEDLLAAGTNTETTQFTFGINWWMSPNMALRINWEHLTFDEDLVIGTGSSPEDAQDILYVRWQIDF